jgi:two-component system, NarL family, response regulator YdfI
VTTVLIAAAKAAARPGLVALLQARKTLDVVVGTPGVPLSEQIESATPDVLLVDLGAARVSAWLRDVGAAPLPPVVVLADDARGILGADALRAGVRAMLPRQAGAEEIVAAVEAAARGLIVLHPDAVQAIQPGPPEAERAGPAAARPRLTPREIEILRMMADGLGNKIIAARLAISAHTVKFHIASIFAKLNAGSRTEAVTIGVRQGLIMI